MNKIKNNRRFLLLFLILFASTSTAQSEEQINKEECTYKGFSLHGQIQFVESFPDITVKVVESFPDIEVKIVESFPDDCGE